MSAPPLISSSSHGRKQASRWTSSVSFLATSLAAVRYFLRFGLHEYGQRHEIGKFRQALLLLFSLRRHMRVLRVLSHPQSAPLTRKYPLLTFKYLGNYVALGLPLSTRRSILVTHFQFLQRKFARDFLTAMDDAPISVWCKVIDQRSFDVAISLNHVIEHEGDLLLYFRMDGTIVYRLIFVFAPGRDFRLPDETVILVSGVQGVPDFDRVRVATRACCDIQPAHVLMAALGALAEVVGVTTILGLHQSRQLFSERVRFSYDRFFEVYGAEIPRQQIYLIRVPYVEKPTAKMKSSHRKRTLRKRQFKTDAAHQVARALAGFMARRAGDA